MFFRSHKKTSIRFRQWRRKSYAVFNGIGKHITIGNVKGIVADTLLRKQKATTGFIVTLLQAASGAPLEEQDDPPEALSAALALPALTYSPKEEQQPLFNNYPFHTWLKVTNVSISHFYFSQFLNTNFMNKKFVAAIGILQLLAITNLEAQEQQLDPITVTSSIGEQRSSETGRNIVILQGEDIAKLPVHSLDELLKYIPGIEVQSRGPQGSQSDISMRGGTYQQVLVLVDGLRLNDPNTGHFSAYIPITPAQIDRIEVLKGASAAIYGSDAVGGVINIITKSFNAPAQQKTKLLNAQIAGGEYNLINANAGGFIQSGNLGIDAGILSNHSTGVPQRGINGFFHNTSASAGLSYRLNPYWRVAFRSAYDTRDFAAQNFYTTFASDTATEKVSSWWNQLKIGYEKDRSKLSLDASYKVLNDEYRYNSRAIPNQNKSMLFQSLLLFQQKFRKHTLFTAGFNYQNKAIVSNDRGDHTLNTAAPFISLSQQVGSHFHLLPSLRMEFIGNNNPELLPQLNASWRLKNFQLRASGGRTIRDADFTERYNNYDKAVVRSGSIGNPWLIPEVSCSYEAGADWFYKSAFKLSSSFFQRFHSRLIDWVTTPYSDMPRKSNLEATGTYALAKNIAEVNTTGFETDVQYRKHFSEKHRITINAGALWLYSKSSEQNPSFYIASHARFLTNFNLQYQFGKAAISLTGIYKSRNPQQATAINAYVSKDYFLMNGRASYAFLNDRLTAFFQVDNIFDRAYSDLLGAPMPGRWMQGGLSFRYAN